MISTVDRELRRTPQHTTTSQRGRRPSWSTTSAAETRSSHPDPGEPTTWSSGGRAHLSPPAVAPLGAPAGPAGSPGEAVILAAPRLRSQIIGALPQYVGGECPPHPHPSTGVGQVSASGWVSFGLASPAHHDPARSTRVGRAASPPPSAKCAVARPLRPHADRAKLAPTGDPGTHGAPKGAPDDARSWRALTTHGARGEMHLAAAHHDPARSTRVGRAASPPPSAKCAVARQLRATPASPEGRGAGVRACHHAAMPRGGRDTVSDTLLPARAAGAARECQARVVGTLQGRQQGVRHRIAPAPSARRPCEARTDARSRYPRCAQGRTGRGIAPRADYHARSRLQRGALRAPRTTHEAGARSRGTVPTATCTSRQPTTTRRGRPVSGERLRRRPPLAPKGIHTVREAPTAASST